MNLESIMKISENNFRIVYEIFTIFSLFFYSFTLVLSEFRRNYACESISQNFLEIIRKFTIAVSDNNLRVFLKKKKITKFMKF